MRSLVPALLAGAALVFASTMGSGSARADTWSIDYTTANQDTAMLNVVTDGPNALSVSGKRDGLDVTGLSSYAQADQLMASSNPFFDFSGLSFTASNGISYNLFTNGGYFEVSSAVDAVGYPQNGVALTNLVVSNVPEPVSITMLGAGLLGLGLAKRRKTIAATA